MYAEKFLEISILHPSLRSDIEKFSGIVDHSKLLRKSLESISGTRFVRVYLVKCFSFARDFWQK